MAMGFSEHHDERKAPLAKREVGERIMCYVRKRVRRARFAKIFGVKINARKPTSPFYQQDTSRALRISHGKSLPLNRF